MDIEITPRKLKGSVRIPASKSHCHRLLIAAWLAGHMEQIDTGTDSEDITVTRNALSALAGNAGGGSAEAGNPVSGSDKPTSSSDKPGSQSDSPDKADGSGSQTDSPDKADRSGSQADSPDKADRSDGPAVRLDCGESGSTLRFLLPLTLALGRKADFYGRGKLPQRPLSPLAEQLTEHGCRITFDLTSSQAGDLHHGNGLKVGEYASEAENSKGPAKAADRQSCRICTADGQLTGGDFFLPGDVSSQFITGLLFALPLTAAGGIIHVTSPLQSKSYVDLTIDVLEKFGIEVLTENSAYVIPGSQKYEMPADCSPEADWSAAAFWAVASALGSDIDCLGLSSSSRQGDRRIVQLVEKITGRRSECEAGPVMIDAADVPDLVPILAVLMAASPGRYRITGAARLRIKESDRLAAMTADLSAIGADIAETEDGLEISGRMLLDGGTVSGFRDHRVVMSMAIAAAVCRRPVIIRGAEAIGKSYPDFFRDYKMLGGEIHEIQLR